MTIGVVGSRRRDSAEDYFAVLKEVLRYYTPRDSMVSGGCPKGADRFAECIWDNENIPLRIHYPNKSQLDRQLLAVNPRAAYAVINYARNKLIARDSDMLIACVATDRKGGTENTIKWFRKLHPNGKLVLV